jgi:hypothetical protein
MMTHHPTLHGRAGLRRFHGVHFVGAIDQQVDGQGTLPDPPPRLSPPTKPPAAAKKAPPKQVAAAKKAAHDRPTPARLPRRPPIAPAAPVQEIERELPQVQLASQQDLPEPGDVQFVNASTASALPLALRYSHPQVRRR